MSTAHAEPAAGDHAHDDDHAHAFDGEPIKTLPADEPRTPAWLPILGLVLFVIAGVAYLVTSSDAPPSDAAPAKTGEAAAPAPSARPGPAPGTPTPDGQAQGTASAPIKMTPEQMKQLKEMLDRLRAQGVPTAAPTAPAAH